MNGVHTGTKERRCFCRYLVPHLRQVEKDRLLVSTRSSPEQFFNVITAAPALPQQTALARHAAREEVLLTEHPDYVNPYYVYITYF